MRCMVLHRAGEPPQLEPLQLEHRPVPAPGPDELLLRVLSCGVCRTDLHVVDGELPDTQGPRILGHQIVGVVEKVGNSVQDWETGQRVGVPWLGGTCRQCKYCESGRENLCASARFTGYQFDGGFAEYCVADARFCYPVPEDMAPIQAAPLLCAGLIGYRAWRLVGDAERVGFYGFGAAAHVLVQLAVSQKRKVYAFTRPGDRETQEFARRRGAVWAGDAGTSPPEPLEAAILFAPAGELVPQALEEVEPGGTVVCAGIHMSDIPSFPYRLLWGERILRSVANLTRSDGQEFLALAPRVPVKTEVHRYALEDTNQALDDLRHGRFQGAAVIVP